MEKIIQQLKEQRVKVKEDFIEVCLNEKNNKNGGKGIDPNYLLGEISNLNRAISILENDGAKKVYVPTHTVTIASDVIGEAYAFG